MVADLGASDLALDAFSSGTSAHLRVCEKYWSAQDSAWKKHWGPHQGLMWIHCPRWDIPRAIAKIRKDRSKAVLVVPMGCIEEESTRHWVASLTNMTLNKVVLPAGESVYQDAKGQPMPPQRWPTEFHYVDGSLDQADATDFVCVNRIIAEPWRQCFAVPPVDIGESEDGRSGGTQDLVFWVRIRLGGREYLGVLDTGATISIVAKKILPCGSLKNTMTTAAIRMGDGHVVHSCGDCEVEVPMGSRTIAHRFYVMDTEAFDFVLGTDFFVQHSQIQSLTLQAPYLLYVDHGSGRESVPLEQSEHTSSYLRLSKEEPSNMMTASKTEDYQLLGEVLDQGLKELGYSREDLSVELFASDKQHVLDLYCSKGKNCSYKFYWPSFGMAYGNPRFSELGKVLTKVALERSRMVLCSPDWGAHGGNESWRNLLDRLTISSVRLPDEAIYVPLGRKTPIGKPGWGSMLSVVDGGLTSIPWEDLDPTLVQAIQRESDGLALGDLKDRLRPQDAVETTPGGDEYVVTDTNAPNSPCHVPVPDESLSVDYLSYLALSTQKTKLSTTPSSCRPVWRKWRTPSTSPH